MKHSRLVTRTVIVATTAVIAACRDGTGPTRNCAGPRLIYTETGGTSGVQIETANGDGSGRSVLLQTHSGASAAAWSPDGCQIAYTANFQLFIANADGSNARAIFTGQSTLDYPAWRPGGRELLFVQGAGFGSAVWRIHNDGSFARPLTTDTVPTWSASWSSDGALITYVRSPSKTNTSPFRLVVVNDNGGVPHVVVDSVNQGPAWVPGTHRIAYGHYDATSTASELRTVGADGSDDRLLAGGLPYPFDLTWTPGGDTLYFAAPGPPSPDFMTHWNIYSVKADGSGFGQVIAGQPDVLRPNARR